MGQDSKGQESKGHGFSRAINLKASKGFSP